jgi:formyltetrahydrofolate hydrolase
MQTILRHSSRRYLSTTTTTTSRNGILRIHGPDQKGIVAATSKLLDHHGFSIVKSEQFTDLNDFYQRTVFQSPMKRDQGYHDDSSSSSSSSRNDDDIHYEMEGQLMELQNRFGLTFVDLDWRIKKKRMAIFVSKYDHCLVGSNDVVVFSMKYIQRFFLICFIYTSLVINSY